MWYYENTNSLDYFFDETKDWLLRFSKGGNYYIEWVGKPHPTLEIERTLFFGPGVCSIL